MNQVERDAVPRAPRPPSNRPPALRRRRSHVRIVSMRQFFLILQRDMRARTETPTLVIRASKQSGGKSSPSADYLATDDVGRKLASLRTAIVSKGDRVALAGRRSCQSELEHGDTTARELPSSMSSRCGHAASLRRAYQGRPRVHIHLSWKREVVRSHFFKQGALSNALRKFARS
jgi:hypothetical protein